MKFRRTTPEKQSRPRNKGTQVTNDRLKGEGWSNDNKGSIFEGAEEKMYIAECNVSAKEKRKLGSALKDRHQ